MVTRMTPTEFREDVRKSRQILEDITGKEVLGYRAPTFSIVKRTEWAHEILRDEGFRYCSSVFPIRHDRYGWPEFGLSPRKMAVCGDRWIWEVPLSVERIGGVNLPFGGGGYLRLYPMSLTKHFFRRFYGTIVRRSFMSIRGDRPSIPGRDAGPRFATMRGYRGWKRGFGICSAPSLRAMDTSSTAHPARRNTVCRHGAGDLAGTRS
jgi:hypothetical protein